MIKHFNESFYVFFKRAMSFDKETKNALHEQIDQFLNKIKDLESEIIFLKKKNCKVFNLHIYFYYLYCHILIIESDFLFQLCIIYQVTKFIISFTKQQKFIYFLSLKMNCFRTIKLYQMKKRQDTHYLLKM